MNLLNIFRKKTFIVKIGPYEIEYVNLLALSWDEFMLVLILCKCYWFFLFGIFLGPLLLLYMFFYTRWWMLSLCYTLWIYYDRHTPSTGGRKWDWYRRLGMFRICSDRFSLGLIKTADLTPGEKYLFVGYPHGVIPFALFFNFGTEANKVGSEVFPGIDIRFTTLSVVFYMPLLRELALITGGCSVAESAIKNLLESNPPKSVVIAAGGPSEAQYAYPGSTYTIIASRRKGFVRIALKTGASLVPVFSFGQNNCYEMGEINSKWVSFLFEKIRQYTRITLVPFRGIGPLQLTFGFLPRSTVMNTVVGEPIPVPKIENPSNELIEEYHQKYFKALEALFEKHKHKYDPAGSAAKLIML